MFARLDARFVRGWRCVLLCFWPLVNIHFKAYIGQVEFDEEAEIFHGEVINTRDVITFQGTMVKSLKKAFKDSVDDYLAFCQKEGVTPERSFSGKFNVRLDPELHRAAYVAAKNTGMSLNTWVTEAIKHEAGVDNSRVDN